MSKYNKLSTHKIAMLTILISMALVCSFPAYSNTSNNRDIERITVKPLKALALPSEKSAPATVVSLNQSQLSTQISAMVQTIHVDLGDIVKKNQPLLTLDCRDYHYAKQQANATYLARKAQASFAKKTFVRNQKLIKQATIPQASLEQAEADYLSIQEDLKALKAQFNNAELITERCSIKAPFTGQITQRYVQKGQLVIPNTPVFELLQTTPLHVATELSSEKANSVQRAKKVFFNSNGKSTPIQLEKIVALIKESTQTQAARFVLLAKSTDLITGMSGRILWQHQQRQLPADYLSQRNGQHGVLIAHRKQKNDNQATVEFVPLPQAQEGQAADINLPFNTLIIDSGRLLVNDKQQFIIQ